MAYQLVCWGILGIALALLALASWESLWSVLHTRARLVRRARRRLRAGVEDGPRPGRYSGSNLMG
jgi:hypothetical protein